MNKISLCAIAGNCENVITRFLDTFQPHFDEVIIVRAIGNQEPDRTIEIATRRGCVTGEYFNIQKTLSAKSAEGNIVDMPVSNTCDWPHVDSFAAARNVAWKLATGDWIMWADLDDALLNGERIREVIDAAEPDVTCIWAPYDIPDQAIEENYRERIAKRGVAKWDGAVHETMIPTGGPLVYKKTNRFRLIHAPVTERSASSERNMRILESIPRDEWRNGHLFYAFTEARQLGRLPEAIDYARQFLKHPDSRENEKYEILLQMAAIASEADQHEQGSELLHQAFRVDPTRAEALYQLANLELSIGSPELGRAYIEQAATCKLKSGTWNARRFMYSWAREDLRWQAMRMTGETARADVEQFNSFRKNGGKISLLHATRGRMEAATLARTKWLTSAKNPEQIEHIFAVDADDEDTVAALSRFRTCIVPANGGCVAAWNEAFRQSAGQLIVQLSDDWEPVAGWDEKLLAAAGDLTQPKVLRVSDGHRADGLLCMAICTRAHIESEGYFFHPSFKGVFSDNWFTDRAQGKIIETGLTFIHKHPAFGEADMDETYSRQNSQDAYRFGATVYNRLNGAAVDWSEIEGWCDFHDVYNAIADTLQNGDKFVEIGSWKGQSISCLAQALQNRGKTGVKLYAVDTFKGERTQPSHLADVAKNGGSVRHIFEANIQAAGVAEMVTIIESDSVQAASLFKNGELAGCFIDAAHEYEPVKADLEAWIPKVAEGGIIAGHDYPHVGVKRAVNEKLNVKAVSKRCWIKI